MRFIRFLGRYARHPLYILTYGVLYFIPGFRIRVRIYTDREVEELLRAGKSIIRFGDGEINLLLGLKNHYHAFSPELRAMLREIVQDYRADSPYALFVPRAITERNDSLRAMGRFNIWLPFKTVFLLSFPKRIAYGDAHCFYYDGYAERVMVPALPGATMVLITNSETIQRQKENPRLPWKDMHFVETSNEGLLESYGTLVRDIDATLETVPEGSRPVLLFATGPVGKHLIKRYSELGYQSIDVGRGAEVMFTDESIQNLI